MKKISALEIGVFVAGIGLTGFLVYRLIKSGALTKGTAGLHGVVYGGSCSGCVKGLPESKTRAHRWLEQQMKYKGENPVEHEIINDTTGMDFRRYGELNQVLLRSYGQAVTYEHIPWNGFGRSAW